MVMDIEQANADLNCMAMAIYAEAHTQSVEAKHGVAQVILNRFRNGHYGNSICEVILKKGQFHGVWDIMTGKHEYPSLEDLLKEKLIAHSVYFRKVANQIGNTTYYFHDDSIKEKNSWFGHNKKIKIGRMNFY